MIPIFATYVANSIKLAEVEKHKEFSLVSKKRNSLIFEYAQNQYFFVYSFGAFVFSGIDQKNANKIVRKFGKALDNPVEKEMTEEYGYELEASDKDVAGFDFAKLRSADANTLVLIADVLAQSVAIDYFDYLTDEIVSKFEQVNAELEKRGRLHGSARTLVRMIGASNSILQASIVRMALLDKPELVWEEAELESFYNSLRKMFELDDRFRIIEFKVQYIRDTSEMAVNLLRDRRANLLETTIVVLLIIEVGLWVWEILVGFGS